jgi:phage terminase large subunit-like protein
MPQQLSRTLDPKTGQVLLVFHRVFYPTPQQPLDFEATVVKTMIELDGRYTIGKVLFDPFQMQAVAQQLKRRRIPMEEFSPTSKNLAQAAQNLSELVQDRRLVMYKNAELREAASRSVAVKTSQGIKLGKRKRSDKVDVITALMMAAYAAVHEPDQPKLAYIRHFRAAFVEGTSDFSDKIAAERAEHEKARKEYIDGLMRKYGQPVSHLLLRH